MSTIRPSKPSSPMLKFSALLVVGGMVVGLGVKTALTADTPFGPNNPFYAPSTLPFQAPPFDKIKDVDYQSAIEAGMAQQRKEMQAIADNSAAPTFENTTVAMEKTGRLLDRAMAAFGAVSEANLNPELQKVK